jgi:hypothetical protein
MATASDAEGFPPRCALIEIHVSDLKELFNSLDPTPFLKRDLDREAEEFIVSSTPGANCDSSSASVGSVWPSASRSSPLRSSPATPSNC